MNIFSRLRKSICSVSMMSVISAKPSGRSLSKVQNAATFIISKPTSTPSYPMRNTRPIYTTTLYLPNPNSTAVPNLWSDRRKPYAYQAPKVRLGIGLFAFMGHEPQQRMRQHSS